jgi:cold shock CspA family protein
MRRTFLGPAGLVNVLARSPLSSPIGTVVRLDSSDEFGFLESSDGHEVYFHRNSVVDDAVSDLVVGARVIFAEEEGEKGPLARTVKLLGRHSLRT